MADMPKLGKADRAALRGALLAERDRGVAVPLIPIDVDVDGDGLVDSWGLDDNDDVTVASGVALEHTGYVSEGDDAIYHLPASEG